MLMVVLKTIVAALNLDVRARVCVCVRVRVCFPMPIHCTITCFRFRARQIDGVECGLFQFMHCLGRSYYMWDEYLYSVLEEVEVRMTVSVTVCVG